MRQRAVALVRTAGYHEIQNLYSPPPPLAIYINKTGDEPLWLRDGINWRAVVMDATENQNALSPEIVSDLFRYLVQAEPNASIHGIFLETCSRATEGPHMFCRGLGAESWRDLMDGPGKPEALEHLRHVSQLIYKVATLATPMVTFMDGFTGGAGAGLALASEFQLATPRTVMVVEDFSLPLIPMGGMSYYLPRLPTGMGVGNWLAMTGAVVDGQDLVHCGLASHYTADAGLVDIIEAGLEDKVTDVNRFEDVQTLVDDISQDVADTWLGSNIEMINEIFSKRSLTNIVEELNVLINANGDGAEWAQLTLDALQQKPLPYLQMTHQMLRQARTKDIIQCLEMEYKVLEAIHGLPAPTPSEGKQWTEPGYTLDPDMKKLLSNTKQKKKDGTVMEEGEMLGVDPRRGDAQPRREQQPSLINGFFSWYGDRDPADDPIQTTKQAL